MTEYLVPQFSRQTIETYPKRINPHLLFYCYLGGESKKREEQLVFFSKNADLSPAHPFRERQSAALSEWKMRYGPESLVEMKLTLVDRMVVGMGIESDFENGLLLHWIHGFPYINGEAIKGAARTWAREQDKHTEESQIFKRIFGTLKKEETETEKISRGEIIFFDALPESDKALFDIDIVTCHYNEYYAGGSEQPGDWMQPNPVHFLTVSAGIKFLFSVAGHDPEPVRTSAQWLKEALIRRGVGAKKRVGYGHFMDTSDKRGAGTQNGGSPLEAFAAKLASIPVANIPGTAQSLLTTIYNFPEDVRSEAAGKLLERIAKKTLKKNANKPWLKKLKELAGG
tara:strand:- start:1380 stop:2402 length:1023 start_codon:yes stop_codon:yes gene_type:complete